jgi:hypothetical protein
MADPAVMGFGLSVKPLTAWATPGSATITHAAAASTAPQRRTIFPCPGVPWIRTVANIAYGQHRSRYVSSQVWGLSDTTLRWKARGHGALTAPEGRMRAALEPKSAELSLAVKATPVPPGTGRPVPANWTG